MTMLERIDTLEKWTRNIDAISLHLSNAAMRLEDIAKDLHVLTAVVKQEFIETKNRWDEAQEKEAKDPEETLG